MTKTGGGLDAYGAKAGASQAAFVHEREAAFWLRARRNRLLADWACDLTDENNQAYLKLLLDEDFARWGDDAFLMVKIKNDLMGFGVFLTEAQLAQVCEEFERRVLTELEERR
jgi:hypothetical protein